MKKKPSRSKIRRIWRYGFYIDGCATVRTIVLRRAIFKQKKGFATISLGLIYRFMVLSQPPSRDNAPLMGKKKGINTCIRTFFDEKNIGRKSSVRVSL
jgi:hypothetical protein